jgi:TolB-like protein
MKKLFLLCIFASISIYCLFADEASDFDTVFANIALKLSESRDKLPEKTVAVYGFQVLGRPGDTYAEYATEKLTHEIVNLGQFMVIERSRIEEILKEQSLSLSGTVDASTASKIGKILAVDAVIIGTIHVTAEGTEFIARIIQSEKGLILASADERVKSGVSAESKDKDATIPEITVNGSIKIKPDKKSYSESEKVTIEYSGLPGNDKDWITFVSESSPDTTYGDWFYTEGKKSGMHTFGGVSPGDYEIRVYFNWPPGGYTVHARLKIKVK